MNTSFSTVECVLAVVLNESSVPLQFNLIASSSWNNNFFSKIAV